MARADIAGWLDTIRERILQTIHSVGGFRGSSVQTSHLDEPCRMTVLTAWDGMDAIRRFAGNSPEKTVIPEFMLPFFREYDAEATFHDEILQEGSR